MVNHVILFCKCCLVMVGVRLLLISTSGLYLQIFTARGCKGYTFITTSNRIYFNLACVLLIDMPFGGVGDFSDVYYMM